MRHNELTVIAPVLRGQENELARWLDRNVGYQRSGRPAQLNLKNVPSLHFLSMFTFTPPGSAQTYLVLEASFDGPRDDFMRDLCTQCAADLAAVMGFCGHDAAEPLADFLVRHRHPAQCFYVSCPGLNRTQIRDNRTLVRFLRRQTASLVKKGGSFYPDSDGVARRLQRNAVTKLFLRDRPPPNLFWVKHGQEIIEIVGVFIPMILMILYVLALGRLPTLEAALHNPLALTGAGVVIAGVAYRLVSKGAGILASAVLLLGLMLSAAGAIAVSRILPGEVFVAARYALVGLAVIVGATVLGLYHLELLEHTDPIDTGWVDIGHMRAVCRDENRAGCMQNHFVNMSVVKPGALRLRVLRFALWFVHLAGVVYFNRGKLGGIPSIHFARWVLLDAAEFGAPLLLFMTNYDASWDSYLGDFVDESSEGVSGIWSNTGGFPRTWGLALGGGSRFEKQFKAYARKGQQRTLAWFSAYPNISVRQKLSNAEVRRALAEMPDAQDFDKQDDLLRRL